MAQVGGDVIGAGLLRLYGVPGSLAAASVIVDVLLQAATQFVFAIVGLLLLIALGADATLAWVAATGLGLGGVMLARLLSGATSRRATHSDVPSSGALLVTGSGGCSARSMPSIRTSPRSTPVAVGSPRQHRRAYGRLDHRRRRGPDRVRLHGPSGQRRRGVGHRKSPACHSRSGVRHSRRARGAGGRPGSAVRRVRNSARAGDRVVAGQAGRRSRARGARTSRLAECWKWDA